MMTNKAIIKSIIKKSNKEIGSVVHSKEVKQFREEVKLMRIRKPYWINPTSEVKE